MQKDALLREIGALTRTVHAIVEIKFKPLNLQKGQSIYLARICENPGIGMKQLSRLLMVDKTTTSKAVQKLVAEKLVGKKQNPEDKRAFMLFPTPKARQAYEVIIEEENRLTRQCYEGFDKSQRRAILKSIQKMRTNIEDDWYEIKRYRTAGQD